MLRKIVCVILLVMVLSYSTAHALELYYDHTIGNDYEECDRGYEAYKKGAEDALNHVQDKVDKRIHELESRVWQLQEEKLVVEKELEEMKREKSTAEIMLAIFLISAALIFYWTLSK